MPQIMLYRQRLRYRIVFLLLGNHKPYHTSWDYAMDRMSKFVRNANCLRENDSSIGQFVFLDRTRFDVTDELLALGCTLFTSVSSEQAAAVQSRMVDFREIVKWDVGDHVNAHHEHLQWLNSQVSKVAESKKVIILAHYSLTIDKRAKDPRYSKSEVGSGFATELSEEVCWTNPAVVLWGFGHTHNSCNFVNEDGKRVVANQKGYYLIPKKAFRPEKAITLEKVFTEGGRPPTAPDDELAAQSQR